MAVTVKSLGIDRLDVTERLSLVEEIWASICADAERFPLSDAQRQELDRRLADDDALPDDVIPWDEVKSLTRVKFQQ